MERLQCGGLKKHKVIKLTDLEKLPALLRQALDDALLSIAVDRAVDNKEPYPDYIVINTDEPYVNEIIEVLKRHNQWG